MLTFGIPLFRYTAGAALTSRCFLPKQGEAGHLESTTNPPHQGLDLWAQGGTARLLSLQLWRMTTMWGDVDK